MVFVYTIYVLRIFIIDYIDSCMYHIVYEYTSIFLISGIDIISVVYNFIDILVEVD